MFFFISYLAASLGASLTINEKAFFAASAFSFSA
jgi:hypothetical protein